MTLKTKVSNYFALFLREQGIDKVFIVTGGASIHLLHSLEETAGIDPIPVHHEQAAGMAADGYARAKMSIGAAISTSGPGATNLLTSIAGAWFDSIPTLFITGQVATYRMKGDLEIRQLGFQETDIVQMARPITKSAVQITAVSEIEKVLHDSVELALSGRPGPVLIDIPDDIQRSVGEFSIPKRITKQLSRIPGNSRTFELEKIKELLKQSSRPIIIFGAGANTAITRQFSKEIANTLGIPILVTWRAKDLIAGDSEFLIGTFGSHGTRWGNFAIQNSDLVLAVGTRLSTRETGGDLNTWARQAKLVHIDIEKAESRKLSVLGKSPELSIHADLDDFLPQLVEYIGSNFLTSNWKVWMDWIRQRKMRYAYTSSSKDSAITGYDFYRSLQSALATNEQIYVDTGCTVAWAMQCLEISKSIRIHHDCNNTAMGWALPAAIGGSLASQDRPTTCISGDGSLMMNLQELSTVKSINKNLRVIVLNNLGYGMVRQTEDQWMQGKHIGTDSRSGDLLFPDFVKLARAFGLRARRVQNLAELSEALQTMYESQEINFLEVVIDPDSKVVPQTRFGYPLEDSEPALSREELLENMIIPTIDKL